MKTIQLLTREKGFYKKYEKASHIQEKAELRKEWVEAANFAISQTFQYFMLALNYAVGIHVIVEGANAANVFK